MSDQDQKGNRLSRRQFVMRGSAAAAAASIGLVATQDEENEIVEVDSFDKVCPDWRITGGEIITLWTKIWPKVVALGWLSELQNQTRNGRTYRETWVVAPQQWVKEELHRIAELIGVHYTSDIPICTSHASNFGIQMEDYLACVCKTPHRFLDPDSQGSVGNAFGAKRKVFSVQYGTALGDSTMASVPDTIAIKSLFVNPDNPMPFTGFSCPEVLYGDTFFWLNKCGLMMPVPSVFFLEDDVFAGYANGGGVIPRRQPAWWQKAQQLPGTPGPALPPAPLQGSVGAPPYFDDQVERERHLFDKLTAWSGWSGQTDPCTSDLGGLSGVALITLVERWPQTVATACLDPAMRNKILGDLERWIMPDVWTEWPSILTASSDSTADEIVLKHDSGKLQLVVPVPEQCPKVDMIFRELIVGHASNPMYSNCY